MKKGFTLIEIIISISIISILTVIAVNTLSGASDRKELEGIADSVVAELDQAKANSQAGKDGESHGIKFNSDSYITFSGSSFDVDDSNNQTFNINSEKFDITEDISNVDNAVIFSKIYGEIGDTVTITIADLDDSNSIDVIIGKLGEVSVIK